MMILSPSPFPSFVTKKYAHSRIKGQKWCKFLLEFDFVKRGRKKLFLFLAERDGSGKSGLPQVR